MTNSGSTETMGSAEPAQVEDHRYQQQSVEANEAGVGLCEEAACKTMIWSELRLMRLPEKPDLPVQHF